MPIIAPWLRPTDVLGSIQAGVHAGLSLRAQEQAAQEAQANREERAQLAADSLKERTLLSSMHMLELAADRAERAGFHKESVDARRAADLLTEAYHKQQLKIMQQNADTNQQRADDVFTKSLGSGFDPTMTSIVKHPVTGEPIGVSVPTGSGSAHFILNQRLKNELSPSAEIASWKQLREASDPTELARTRERLGLVPQIMPAVPGKHFWNSDVPATTNWVPASAATALQAPPPTPGLPTAPNRIRVREKATGQTGWWEGGEPPEGYETVE